MDCEIRFKVIIIGDSSVGKSCMLSRFTDNSFDKSYISTIGVDFKVKVVNVGGTQVKLQIWDTAGQERFRNIVNSYYRGAHIVLLTFDLSSYKSFVNIDNWYSEAKSLTLDDNIKIIMVGCKDDLVHEVSDEEIQQKASRLNIPFCACSALKSEGVNEVFDTVIKSMIDIEYKSWLNNQLTQGIQKGAKGKVIPDSNTRPNKCCTIL